MRMRSLVLVVCVMAGAAALAGPPQYKGHQLAEQAKLPIERARALALKARPGLIIDQELEKEAGGSGLRYSFDIKSDGKKFEVGVDAVTGKILENSSEGLLSEAKEETKERFGR